MDAIEGHFQQKSHEKTFFPRHFSKYIFMKIFLLQINIFLLLFLRVYAQDPLPMKIDLQRSIGRYGKMTLSQLGNDIQYIPLKGSKEGFFLEKIVNISFSAKQIIASDFQRCILFDRNGIYLRKIGNQGKGPGEYTFITQVDFSNTEEFIYISFDFNILKFSLQGDLVKSISMQKGKAAHGFEEPICSWVPFLDNLFLVDIPNYSGKEKSMFVILNEGGQVTKKYDNYQICNKKYNVVNTWDSNTSIYKFKDFYTLKKVTNDTLFRLTKNFHIFPRYVFYLGKYRFPFEEYDGSFVNFMKEITNYITIISTIETTDYFFLLCDFGNHTDGIKLARVALGGQTSTYRSSIVKAVYQKSLDRLILLTPSINDGFINDIDGGMNFFPQKVINDSILVSWVDAYQLKAHVASSTFKNSTPKYPEKKKALEKLANSLNENDNPVLMLVKLK